MNLPCSSKGDAVLKKKKKKMSVKFRIIIKSELSDSRNNILKSATQKDHFVR